MSSEGERWAAFVAARLDEDEAAARAATPGEWAALDSGVLSIEDDGQWPVSETASARDREDRVHIARHHPARALRQVESGRRLIERYERATAVPESVASFIQGQDDGCRQACFDAIRDVARWWSDHPDYAALSEPS